jgi:hypothetical protein
MVAACFISVRMGLISSVQEKLCVEGISRAGLPTKLPCYLEPVELIEAMNERRAAPIMAQMNPIRAQQITAELARRRQPGNQPASQIPARAS